MEFDDRFFVTFTVFCLSAAGRDLKAETESYWFHDAYFLNFRFTKCAVRPDSVDGVKVLLLLILLTRKFLFVLPVTLLILLPRKFWELVSYRLGLKDEFHTFVLTAFLSKICNCQKRSAFNSTIG